MVEMLKLMSQRCFESEQTSVMVLDYSLTYQGCPAQIQAEINLSESPWVQAISVVEGEVFKGATLDTFDDLRDAIQNHLSTQDLTDLMVAPLH